CAAGGEALRLPPPLADMVTPPTAPPAVKLAPPLMLGSGRLGAPYEANALDGSDTTRTAGMIQPARMSARLVRLVSLVSREPALRSEEHTSELQSREKLVC